MSAWQEGRDRVLGQIGRIGLTGGIYDYGLVRLEGGQKGDTRIILVRQILVDYVL